MRGLFINNKKAKDSIWESGYMAYQCLILSQKYTLDYIEIDIDNRNLQLGYDFYLFNYHFSTMSWLETRSLKKKFGFVMTLILEVAPNDPFVFCPKNDFNAYCVLDPTIKIKNKTVFAFPRPLEKINFELPSLNNDVPVIGSFGFATKGKGFQHVVEAVNKEFEKAIVKINIPFGEFVPNSKEYAIFLGEYCKKISKKGIEVKVTHDFMNKEALIKWCATNTLNCFLYDRNLPGLAATTDQAIVSERPLIVSNNNTFRHITQFLKPFPNQSLKESIANSTPIVQQLKKDWSAEKFAEKFESIIKIIPPQINNKGNLELPILKKTVFTFLNHRYKKYIRMIKLKNLKYIFAQTIYPKKYI